MKPDARIETAITCRVAGNRRVGFMTVSLNISNELIFNNFFFASNVGMDSVSNIFLPGPSEALCRLNKADSSHSNLRQASSQELTKDQATKQSRYD